MTPIELPIYVATLEVHDGREPKVTYTWTRFEPLPAQVEEWGDGRRRTVTAGATEPAFLVTAPAGSEVATVEPSVVPRLLLPGRKPAEALEALSVVGCARDGLFGLAIRAVGAVPIPPSPFVVPEAEMAVMRAATAPKGAGKAEPAARIELAAAVSLAPAPPERRVLDVDWSVPAKPPVKRKQLSMFGDAEDLEPATAGVGP